MMAMLTPFSGPQLAQYMVLYGALAVLLWRFHVRLRRSAAPAPYLFAAAAGVALAWVTQALPTWWTAVGPMPTRLFGSYAGVALGLASVAVYFVLTTHGGDDEPSPAVGARLRRPPEPEPNEPPRLVLLGAKDAGPGLDIPWAKDTPEPVLRLIA